MHLLKKLFGTLRLPTVQKLLTVLLAAVFMMSSYMSATMAWADVSQHKTNEFFGLEHLSTPDDTTSSKPPTEPSTAPPTEPSTAPPTESSTAPPTEPSTAPPTELSTAPSTCPPTVPITLVPPNPTAPGTTSGPTLPGTSANPDGPGKPDTPNTGDESHLHFWFFLMLASAFLLAVLMRARISKRTKASRTNKDTC